MATSNQTPNFGLSQYAANDPVKFLTNYNEDMVKIDQSSVPNTRKIAGINLQDDILLSELVAAGLADGTGGAANNALALGGVAAEAYPNINHIDEAVLTLINGWSAIWGGITARRFGRVLEINLYGAFTGPSNTIIAMLPTGYNPSQSVHAIQIPTGFLVVEGDTIKAQATSIDANSFSAIV